MNCFANIPLGKSGHFPELKVGLGKSLDISDIFTCIPEHHIYCQLLSTNICCAPTSWTGPRAMG